MPSRQPSAIECYAMASTSSYRDYEVEAHELVERLLHSSVEKLYREQSNQTVADQLSAQQTARKDVVWPKGNVFTVDKGLEAIQDLVKVIKMMGLQSSRVSDS